jgi:dethiobiotin synthetase
LGSINHTLLSIQCLKQAQIPIAGLVFTGKPFEDNEDIIAQFHPDLPIWPRLNHLDFPFKNGLTQWASSIKPFLADL